MKLYTLLVTVLTIWLTACASSSYQYVDDSGSLVRGEPIYYLGDVSVVLSVGEGARENDTRFADQNTLEESFLFLLLQKMNEENLLVTNPGDASAFLNVQINYQRTFNEGGESLNKPQVSYLLSAINGAEKKGLYFSDEFTTDYGYLQDAVVNAQIAASGWGAEDEPRDLEVVAQVIIDRILDLESKRHRGY